MKKYLLAVFIIGFSHFAFCEDACEYIQNAKAESKLANRESGGPSTWDIIKSILFPQSQFTASFIEVTSHKGAQFTSLPTRNIILLFGVPQDKENLIQSRKVQMRELENELNEIYRKFQNLYGQRNIADCRLMNSLEKLDMDLYKAKIEEHEKYKDVSAYEVDQGLSSIVKSFLEDKKRITQPSQYNGEGWDFNVQEKPIKQIQWEVVRAVNLEDLQKVLRDSNIENIIIITHGSDDGSIYDSYLRLIPSSIFESMSPSIRSLSLYNCYGSKSTQFYNVLNDTPSIWKNRLFFFLGKTSVGEQAPSYGLKTFLKSVDSVLQKNPGVQNLNVNEESTKICNLKVNSDMGKNYGFYLNDNYLGTLSAAELLFQYQCIGEVKSPVRVKIKNLSPSNEEAVQSGTVNIEFKDENFHLTKDFDIKNENKIFLKLQTFQ